MKKLTPKEHKFVQGRGRGKSQREAYMGAYDTKASKEVIDVQASQLASKPKIQEALKELFGIEETKQIVQNVHKLAISANDEKVQLDASKEWLNRAMGRGGEPQGNNFIQVNNNYGDRYSD